MRKFLRQSKMGCHKRAEWEIATCPFCGMRLKKVESIRRRVLRICRCSHCGKIINEKHVVW